MKLRRTPTGRECAGDRRITFERVRQADFPDGQRRSGWLVRVSRGGRRRPERHLARTLNEASAWARRRWEPWFLAEVKNSLPAAQAFLYREAVDGGDPVAFRAMLDAAEEAGGRPRRGGLIARARSEGTFPGDFPLTQDELREEGENAARMAVAFIGKDARVAYEARAASRRGTNHFRSERTVVYYENTPSGERAGRPHLLELAKARLKGIGVECLAEAEHPADGEDAGHTVALAFYPVDDHNLHEVRVSIFAALLEAGARAS